MGPKRPHFSPQEIDEQLQQVYLSTDFIGSQNESLEHLTLIIRNIHASRQQDAYLRQLDSYIKDKEGEIEEVCKTNYQVEIRFNWPTNWLKAAETDLLHPKKGLCGLDR
jgi:exocyst complex component 6